MMARTIDLGLGPDSVYRPAAAGQDRLWLCIGDEP
jgi:hypothetical protein